MIIQHQSGGNGASDSDFVAEREGGTGSEGVIAAAGAEHQSSGSG